MKRLLVVALALFMVLGFVGMASAAPILHLEPSTADLLPDESVDIEFWLDTGLEEGVDPGLTSMGLLISFDPSIAEVTNLVVPMGPGGWMGGGGYDNVAGTANMAGMMWMDPFPPFNKYPLFGDVLLGTVTFHILPGVSACSICSLITSDLNPAPFDNFVLEDETVWDNIIEYGSGELHVVPIPSTLLLLGTGLISFLGLSRRRIAG